MSTLVIAETVWVLERTYGKSHHEIVESIEILLSEKNVEFEDDELIEAALAQYRLTSRLGFSDCLILEIAKKAGHLPLGTFDRHLGRLEGTERL